MTPSAPSATHDLLASWRLLPVELRRSWIMLALMAVVAAVVELAAAALLLRLITGFGAAAGAGSELLTLGPVTVDTNLLAAVFVTLLVAKTLLRLTETRRRETLTDRTAAVFAARLLRAWLSTSLARQLHSSQPAILDDVQTTSLIAGRDGIASLVLIFSEGVIILALGSVLLAFSPPAALGLMGGFGLLAAGMMHTAHRRHAGYTGQLMAARPALYGFLHSALGGAREIRIAHAVPAFVRRFTRLRATSEQPQVNAEVWRQAPLFIFEGLFLAGAACLLLLLRGDAALPLLVVALYAALRLLPAVNRLAYRVFALQGARPGIRRLLEAPEPAHSPATSQASFEQSLVVADAWLTYPGRTTPALAGATLTIVPGEILAVVGPSGHGKSTLLLLLAGLLAPDRGHVLADGRLLHPDDPAWHGLLGYVGQESPLLDDTLRNNITLDEGPEDTSALEAALRVSRLDEVVARLPQGLDTPLGPGGRIISGGERQRIALARSLYRRPRLLLLDEATAFVDPPTEQAILAGLAQLTPPPAVVFVTHRLAAASQAARVAFFRNGSIEATGAYDTLVSGYTTFAAFASGSDTTQRG